MNRCVSSWALASAWCTLAVLRVFGAADPILHEPLSEADAVLDAHVAYLKLGDHPSDVRAYLAGVYARDPRPHVKATYAWDLVDPAWGKSVDADRTLGRTLAQASANAGEARGMAVYALCLLNGYGGPQDPLRGRAYAVRASAQGDVLAAQNLSLAFLVGNGGPADLDNAATWAHRAGLALPSTPSGATTIRPASIGRPPSRPTWRSPASTTWRPPAPIFRPRACRWAPFSTAARRASAPGRSSPSGACGTGSTSSSASSRWPNRS